MSRKKANSFSHICWLLIIIFTLSIEVFAQNINVSIEPIIISENYISAEYTSIFQDSYGYMWFGTRGLLKYNGYNAIDYNYKPSLVLKVIWNICEDPNGNIYFTDYSGLHIYNRKSDTIQHQKYLSISKILKTEILTYIFFDHSGNCWLGSNNHGLFLYNLKNQSYQQYLHNPNDSQSISEGWINIITEDSNGNLWIGTDSGLNKFDPSTKKFTRFENIAGDSCSLSHNRVFAIIEDPWGSMWIGTADGLNRLDTKTNQLTQFKNDPDNQNSLSDNRINSIIEFEPGVLLIGTSNGLNLFDIQDDNIIQVNNEKNEISTNDILVMHKDRSGMVWIGTTYGVFLLVNHSPVIKNIPLPNSTPEDFITKIEVDKIGDIWMYIYKEGLIRFSKEESSYSEYYPTKNIANAISSNIVNTIYKDSEGTLWVSTSAGLDRYNENTDGFDHVFVPDKIYTPQIYPVIDSLLLNQCLITSISKVGNLANLNTEFNIKAKTKVGILCVGERDFKNREILDYGQIIHDGKILWKMKYEKTLYAGGKRRNGVEIDFLDLNPGGYLLEYKSNDNYSYTDIKSDIINVAENNCVI